MNTTHESLVAAGWKQLPDGQWQSPLTRRVYPERTARLLAAVPGLTTAGQLVRKSPRRFIKR